MIELKKFGKILTSRQDGKEALAAINPVLNTLGNDEDLYIDFFDVATFTPSWADEFITPLKQRYGSRVILLNTTNASVQATLKLLDDIAKTRS